MKHWLYLLVLTISLPSILTAEMNLGDQSVAVELGPMVPLSNIDLSNVGGGTSKVGSTGFAGGGQYLYYVSPTIGLGADLNYSGSGTQESTTLIPRGVTETSIKSAVFMAVVEANMIPTGNVIPYLVSGLGTHGSNSQSRFNTRSWFCLGRHRHD